MYYKVYVIILLLSSFSYSQITIGHTKITGNVKSLKYQEPIIGATVVLDSSSYETLTDINGDFTITNVTPGIHKLKISYLLYETQIIDHIVINKGETKSFNIDLEEWGKSDAENDIKNGDVKILVEGMIVTCKPAEVINELCRQYGFKYEYTGCVIIGVDNYNKRVYEYLDQLNGTGWREDFETRLKDLCGK